MKKFALLGHEISYSLSPKIHSLIASELGLWLSYELFDCSPQALKGAVLRLKDGFDGFNITKPYKTEIIPYLSSLDPLAKSINAVNTVLVKTMQGFNTDYSGFRGALSLCNTIIDKNKKVLILGAGGAANSAVKLLKNTCQLSIYNRTTEKAELLAKGTNAAVIKDFRDYSPEVIINCTTLGLKGENCLPEKLCLDKLEFSYDMVYLKEGLTPFLSQSKKLKAEISDGLCMLILQAIEAECIFCDLALSEEEKHNLCKKITKSI